MKIRLVAVGERMPAWVDAAWADYSRRLGGGVALELVPVPGVRRSTSTDVARAVREEGRRLLAAIPERSRVIALDAAGRQWSTIALAEALDGWLHDGRDVALLVGGPDGLDPACLEAAERRWSLSALTLPHALVRVVVAEQIYRAWSVLAGHPYHRA